MTPAPTAAARMDGKCVVVTGASSGIGAVLAGALGRAGADLILVGRDPARLGTIARSAVESGTRARTYPADLADTATTRTLAAKLREENPRVDVLINNAGAIHHTFAIAPSGDERTFGLNVLAPFILTETMMPRLAASGAGRVVNVSSSAHSMGVMDFEDLDRRRAYGGWAAYSQSKLALLLLTYEAARRHADRPVTFNACHPGFVRTAFGEEGSTGVRGAFFETAKRIAAISPEKGAETPLYLATSPDVAHMSGAYFVRRRPHRSSPASHDAEAARRLWEVCERRSGLAEAPAVAV